jgi:hypothetical protein
MRRFSEGFQGGQFSNQPSSSSEVNDGEFHPCGDTSSSRLTGQHEDMFSGDLPMFLQSGRRLSPSSGLSAFNQGGFCIGSPSSGRMSGSRMSAGAAIPGRISEEKPGVQDQEEA